MYKYSADFFCSLVGQILVRFNDFAHGLSLIISVRIAGVNNWYNAKFSGLEGMVVGFESRGSQFRQSPVLS